MALATEGDCSSIETAGMDALSSKGDISGIDLAIQMRAQYPSCKILLFSGQAATLDLFEGARARGYDFRLLQEPVSPSEFLSEIGQLSA
jgi:hypothetical protein